MAHNDCDSVPRHNQQVKLMDGHFVPTTTASPAGATAKQSGTPFVTLKSIFEQSSVERDLSKKQTDGFLATGPAGTRLPLSQDIQSARR
jgi:hypothetical protein